MDKLRSDYLVCDGLLRAWLHLTEIRHVLTMIFKKCFLKSIFIWKISKFSSKMIFKKCFLKLIFWLFLRRLNSPPPGVGGPSKIFLHKALNREIFFHKVLWYHCIIIPMWTIIRSHLGQGGGYFLCSSFDRMHLRRPVELQGSQQHVSSSH